MKLEEESQLIQIHCENQEWKDFKTQNLAQERNEAVYK